MMQFESEGMYKKVKYPTYMLVGLCLGCAAAYAKETPPASATVPSLPSLPPPFTSSAPDAKQNPPAPITLKKAWIDHVQKELPILLCNKDHYFVQCYEISPQECEAFTQVLVRACLNSVSIALPPELSVEQGQHWGQMVGRCTYDLYEKFLEKKKKDLPACKSLTPETEKATPPSSTKATKP